jgi:hypothetical protein
MAIEQLVRIRSVETLTGYRVRLGFTDGSLREVDLERYLHGPIFEAIRSDPQVFRSVKVDKRMGTIVWPNGADIDPDVLYGDLTPAWMDTELVLAV